MGLKVAQCLLEDEVTQRCGQRHERVPNRSETRFGHQRGFVTIAGQKVPVEKPRVRSTDGRGEAELERYNLLQSPEAMPQAALEHLVNGVSTRRYEQVVHLAREGFGIKKSSVSRGFVRASAEEVQRLAERRFDDERFAVIFIDAQPYAGEMMVVALGITTAGEKRLLGLRQGATENAVVVTSLLEELRERGVQTDVPTLFVLDGAKALRGRGRAGVGQVRRDPAVPGPQAEERRSALAREASRRIARASECCLPRNQRHSSPHAARGDGKVAAADQPGRSGQPRRRT